VPGFSHALLALVVASSVQSAAADWRTHAGNPQHTALSAVAAQPLQVIRWTAPVDLAPPAGTILIHYGSPLVSAGNTVILPVKTGTSGGFRVEARAALDGSLLWSADTDYVLPPHNWTPTYAPALTADNRLYFAGAGGTVYFRDAVDVPGPAAIEQRAFYGLANYTAARASFDATVFINTPITVDSAGTIYFGFRTSGSAPLGLQSGVARIDAGGNGSWVSAVAASGGDPNITRVPHQAAPTLSNDEQTLYVVVASADTTHNHYLVGLDPATLALKESSPGVPMRVALKDPRNGGTANASLLEDGSGSPMVGPDGDVYYGVMANPFNVRGWLLHFSADLTQTKIPGGFGWDITPSVVPATAVPFYTGASSYLLFTKYNDYAGIDGGTGVNRMAVLDPNATMVEPHASSNGQLVMQQILTVTGPTPDTVRLPQFPDAVQEWCINTAAVDGAGRAVFATSEDGKLYRWDLATNTLAQSIALSSGIREAYTPTLIGPDGTVYAINHSTLSAVGAASMSPPPGPTPTCVPDANHTISGQVRYYRGGAPVPGATVLLSGGTTASTQTDAAGQYSFSGVPGCNVHLEVQKLGDLDGGISTLDAAYTLQAIAGVRTLDAEQRLACDVTGNGTLSTLDATEILQQRVGLLATFPAAQTCMSDWLFRPAPAAAPNQTLIEPLNTPGSCRRGAIEFSPLGADATGQDFSALVIGDCTGNWH
jgi:hypothetical protein